jgi:DNA gyrase/topoisomerase IV subunit A
LKELIAYLKKLLGSESEILSVIKKEVQELKKKFGDERRTQVMKRVAEIAEKDLIEKKDVVVMVTEGGYIKRVDVKTYREQKRGGQGVTGADLKEEDFVRHMVTCSTHDYLLFFTTRGRVFWLKANDVPVAERQGRGKALVNVLDMREEKIAHLMALKDFENGYLMFATKLGMVKKIPLKDLSKLSCEHQITILKIFQSHKMGDLLFTHIKYIHECLSTSLTHSYRYIVRFQPEDTPTCCEEQQVIVRRTCDHVSDKVFFLEISTGNSLSAPLLLAIRLHINALDIAAFSYHHNDILLLDKILLGNLSNPLHNLSSSLITKLLLKFLNFLLDNRKNFTFASK